MTIEIKSINQSIVGQAIKSVACAVYHTAVSVKKFFEFGISDILPETRELWRKGSLVKDHDYKPKPAPKRYSPTHVVPEYDLTYLARKLHILPPIDPTDPRNSGNCETCTSAVLKELRLEELFLLSDDTHDEKVTVLKEIGLTESEATHFLQSITDHY